MTLKVRVMEDLKEAMKRKDTITVSTLRLLLSEIKNKEIDKKGELTDDEVLAIIQKAVKQREEALEHYKTANREDLIDKETKELEVLKSYLPKPLTEEELEVIIDEAIRSVGAVGPKDIGSVMKVLMPKVRGRIDGKVVNEKVREKLSAK